MGRYAKEELLADAVSKLSKSSSAFCCGGYVRLPDHDQKSLTLKLLGGDSKGGEKLASSSSEGSVGPKPKRLADSITDAFLKEVIENSSVAAFGDLKRGATVVDYTVRKAWEAFFHLDFDYSHIPAIKRYVPELSEEVIVAKTRAKRAQLEGLEGRATIEDVSKEAASKAKNKRTADDMQFYKTTFTAKVTEGDSFVTTKVTADKVQEPQWSESCGSISDMKLSFKCECTKKAKKGSPKWCEHALATLLAMTDAFSGTMHPDYEYHQALFLRPIMKHVQEHLAHGEAISLQPYKINIYGEGGFFKQHVDSPRDLKSMIGTLVVCLPSEHKGGQLVVSHGDVDHVFDFGPLSGDKTLVQWAAMYGDCLHRVREVEKGYRTTITFTIIQEGEKEDDDDEFLDDSFLDDDDEEKWSAVRDDVPEMGYKITVKGSRYKYPADYPTVEEVFDRGLWNKPATETEAKAVLTALKGLKPRTEYVAILLNHDYTQENLLRPEILKGSDWALYHAVSQAFPVDLLPVVVRNQWTLDIEDEYGYEGNSVCSCYAFTKNDILWLAGERSKPHYEWEAAAQAGKVTIVAPSSGKKIHLDHTEEGYIGNEWKENAETLDVYFQAALVINVSKKS